MARGCDDLELGCRCLPARCRAEALVAAVWEVVAVEEAAAARARATAQAAQSPKGANAQLAG